MRAKQVYCNKQRVGLRLAAKKTRVSRYLVSKILKKVLKKKPFKGVETERLTASQKLRRVTLCRKLLNMPRLQNKLKNTWFTDESCKDPIPIDVFDP